MNGWGLLNGWGVGLNGCCPNCGSWGRERLCGRRSGSPWGWRPIPPPPPPSGGVKGEVLPPSPPTWLSSHSSWSCRRNKGFNSLESEFSSQGHFHTLQLLNVPQFLFCRVVRLKTAPRGNFSHTLLIRDCGHTHQLANA